MDRKSSTSTSSAILVETEIVMHLEEVLEKDLDKSYAPSVVSVVQSMPDLKFDMRSPTATGEALPSRQHSTKSRQVGGRGNDEGDHEEGHDDERRSIDNPMRNILDVLSTAPPPGHFMSIPDHLSSSSEDEIWKKFKVFRKRQKGRRKRSKPRPPVIQLPDSAVAATTIGGYRHIAISIPFEYSYLGPLHPSGYTTRESMEEASEREVDTTLRIPRNWASYGAGTVLKPVAEDRETISTTSPSPKVSPRSERHTALAAPPRRTSSDSPTRSAQQRPPTRRGKEPEAQVWFNPGSSQQFSPTQTKFGPVPHTDPLASHPVRKEPHTGTPKRVSLKEPGSAQTAIPPSQQSTVAGAKENPSEQTSTEKAVHPDIAVQDHAKDTSRAEKPPETISPLPSIKLTLPVRRSSKKAKTGPKLQDPGDKFLGSPKTSRSLSPGGLDNGNGGGETRWPSDVQRRSVTESLETTGSSPRLFKAETARVVRPPSSTEETDSPLNLVFPRPPFQTMSRSVQTDLPSPRTEIVRALSRRDRVRERKQKDIEQLRAQLKHNQPPPDPSLPKVVPRGNPAWPESPVLGRFSQHLGSPSSSRPISAVKPKGKTALDTMRTMPGPSFSTSSSLSSLMGADRTSYRRRRERALAAEQQQQALDRLSRQELLEQVQRAKEQRIHDMEKRLRRLERNGDVWLQSMVPLMEGLNSILRDQNLPPREPGVPSSTTMTAAGQQLHEQQLQAPPALQRRHSSASVRSAHSLDASAAEYPRVIDPMSRQRRRPVSLTVGGPSGSTIGGGGRAGSSLRGGSYHYRHHYHHQGSERFEMPETAVRSPLSSLQHEFERELAIRRAMEQREEELDERVRRGVDGEGQPSHHHHHHHHHQAHYHYHSSGGDGSGEDYDDIGGDGSGAVTTGVSSTTTEGDAGYYYSHARRSGGTGGGGVITGGEPRRGGWESLEPLMRELQGAARFDVAHEGEREREERGTDDDDDDDDDDEESMSLRGEIQPRTYTHGGGGGGEEREENEATEAFLGF
ncbi:hypothetical protein F4778DRAFT_406685 [Xylariomycetidae sp. FL2044]|nr:hypothetical protein F4778DRAFT_406685 [Xylariomycetidae sp. FL2044]